MYDQMKVDYERIEKAITFICQNIKEQPSLDDIAAAVGLSAYHLQRIFSAWAGVSPKKFIQYLNIQHAKKILENQQATLLDTANEIGLSGTSRLHDLFVNIESMTPGEFKEKGRGLSIHYSYEDSIFGPLIVASTNRGVCHLSFYVDKHSAFMELEASFPNADLVEKKDTFQENALFLFKKDWGQLRKVKLHLAGTAYQLKVWESLLKIPLGGLSSYQDIAAYMGSPQSSRAVGSAVGKNPIAFLIPCHRVIKRSGLIGEYRWGADRKATMIGWEAALADLID